ncbi:hypothetical protein Angca_002670 [Angiostrongylus cantonensis]|nr:hypothetical protein Angca_002670 [Angiostrongylus cantonensis]
MCFMSGKVSFRMSTASDSVATGDGTTIIDGYKISREERPPISWAPFSSNSWRTRLKRVHTSLVGISSNEADESSCSGVPLRYTYAYPNRCRDPDSEFLTKIESDVLLEIARSSAQVFKDFETALKKPEDTKSSSKKGRKSSVVPKEELTVASKRRSTKRRSKESEEKSESEKELRHTEKALVPPKRKEPKRSDKLVLPKQAYLDISKEVNDGDLDLNIFPGQSVSSTDIAGRTDESEVSELRMDKSSSVNIKSWPEERIISHFGLKEFTIDISEFPHHELQPSTSSQFAGSGAIRKLSTDELANDEEHSQLSKNKENLVGLEPKKRKRKRSLSSSSSRSCSSSDRGRNNHSCSESGTEPSPQTRNTSKKKGHSERPCVECGRFLDSCVMDWKETLGTSTVWCSRDCIERRVARAHEVLPEGYGALTLIRGDGQLLTTGPTLANLAEFIFKYPEYEPVLPVAKKKQVAKNDQGPDTKKSVSRPLSKDADRVRFNVRRAFSDALLKRAKMDKVKSAMKLCKDVSESIEAALFKSCGSNFSSTSYKTWTKAFIENVADCRNKGFYYRVLTGMISVHKVVTLDRNQMRKPEYSSPLDVSWNSVMMHLFRAMGINLVQCLSGTKMHRTVVRVCGLDQNISTGGAMKKEGISSISTKVSTTSTKKAEPTGTVRVARRSEARKAPSANTSLSTLDSILGDGAKDTTEQHLSHFYDVNCSICLAKQKSQAEAERKEKEEKERQREEDRRFREMLPPIRQPDYARCGGSSGLVDLDCSMNSGRNSADELRRVRTPESTGAACASDDDYAVSYGDPEESSPLFSDEREIEAQRNPSTRDGNTSSSELMWSCTRTVWSGQISLNNASMRTSLCLISNPVAFRAAPELPPKLRIKGRIVPLIVFDYVHETMRNGEHHVAVLRLTDPVDFECEQRFLSMYEDMVRKGRYFAVDVPQDTCFKDMYLMPLAADEEPPAILLPFDGPGIPKRHSPMIICVMVIYGPGYSRGLKLKCPQEPQVLSDRRQTPLLSRRSPPSCVPIPYEFGNLRPDISRSHIPSVSMKLLDTDERSEVIDDPSSRINAPPDLLPAETTDIQTVRSPQQFKSETSTPREPSDVAVLGEADSLLPSKFFLMCKEAAKEPSKVLNADEIETLPDLLLYIQLNNKPREIKEVVSRFMASSSLSDDDRELIRKKVLEKIANEKKKKSQNKVVAAEESTSRSVSQPKVDGVKKSESDETFNLSSLDFDSLNQLSTFVGASVQDLLKQGEKLKEDAEFFATPPSPPPPPPPPSAVAMTDDNKCAKIGGEVANGEGQRSLPCSEMLPGPPPVPPVYGDNDSSGTDSPSENNNRKTSDSPTLPRPPPFPSLSVVPLPPPPSVVPDIAVPPPPPPPPMSTTICVSTASARQPEPTAQSFITAPPPPPSMFGSATSTLPAIPPPPLGMFHPPAPGMIPDIPFPTSFINGPPPPPPFVAMGLPSQIVTSASRAPVPPMGITASSSMMNPVRPSGFPNQGQVPVPHVDHKEFFPCTSSSRPGFIHTPHLHYPAHSNLSRMDTPRDRSGAVPGSLPANRGSTKCSGATSMSTIPSTFGELAPLPSQLMSSTENPKGLLPSGVVSSASHGPTDRNLTSATSAPAPSPPSQQYVDNSQLVGKNGPRTPSPEISKKHVYNAEIERLKKDIEKEKRDAELQARLNLLEMEFQARLPKRAPQSSSSKEDNCPPWHVSTNEGATSSKEDIAKDCANDSDSMDVDGGEGDPEEEVGDKASGNDHEMSNCERTPTDIPRDGYGVGRGQSFDYAGGRAFFPQVGPHGSFMGASRAVTPHRGRFGFITTSGQADRSRGGFFPPPMRGVNRGAPNLRRGFPNTGGFRSPMTQQPFRGRGGFYGPRRTGPRRGV